MSFADLPTELLLPILTYTAEARGLKRALRLRCVCKRFANLMHEAVYDSTLLEFERNCNARRPTSHREFHSHSVRGLRAVQEQRDKQRIAGECVTRNRKFFQDFLAYRALNRRCYLPSYSRYLTYICKVAQDILQRRVNRSDDTISLDAEYRECVADLCALLLPYHYESFFFLNHDFTNLSDITNGSVGHKLGVSLETLVSSDDEDRLRWTLSAAAHLGDIEIVNELLEHNYVTHNNCFPSPLQVAARAGHLEIVRTLLNDSRLINLGLTSSDCRYLVHHAASRAGHDDIVDLVIDPDWEIGEVPTSRARIIGLTIKSLSATVNIDIFRLWLSTMKDEIPDYELKWLPDNITIAAGRGAMDKVRFLFELGAPVDGRFDDKDKEFNRPISKAALNGHEEIVTFLLDNGAELGHALIAAAMGGKRSIAAMLMERGPRNHSIIQMAFLEAFKRENTAMILCLEENGGTLSGRTRVEAVKIAKKEGLESMKEEYLDQRNPYWESFAEVDI